ncbi:MAG: hypothetical protein ACRDZY_20510, partial [Acidimicrobiales bacterium]
VLAWLGARAGLSLAPQAYALVPFGVFHDLRWLIVYSNSWVAVIAEGLVLLVGRSLVTALTVREAWPTGADRPPMTALAARAGLFTLAAAVLLATCTVLLFGLAVAPVSWFFLAAVPAALIVALLFHHGAIAPGWWRQGLRPAAVGWVVLTFIVLSASAEVIAAVPVPAAVAVAGTVGLFDAWAWRGLVRAVVGPARTVARFRPVAPAGLVGLATIVVGGTVLGFALVAPAGATTVSPARGTSAGGSATIPGAAVLVASGYGTHWNGVTPPHHLGPYLERRFSYAGLGPGGRPLPYTSTDTTRPLVSLERLMAAQVEVLHAASHGPVSIVADSEGSLVAKAYLAASPG